MSNGNGNISGIRKIMAYVFNVGNSFKGMESCGLVAFLFGKRKNQGQFCEKLNQQFHSLNCHFKNLEFKVVLLIKLNCYFFSSQKVFSKDKTNFDQPCEEFYRKSEIRQFLVKLYSTTTDLLVKRSEFTKFPVKFKFTDEIGCF